MGLVSPASMGGTSQAGGALHIIHRRGGTVVPPEARDWDQITPLLGVNSIKRTRDFLRQIALGGMPQPGDSEKVAAWKISNQRNLWRAGRKVVAGVFHNTPTLYGAVHIRHISGETGEVTDYGLASLAVVTTAGVGFLVDAWQNTVEMEIMKYHGVGTGTTAEASGDTALVTESTTALNPDSTRATGTTTEGASANIFRSVGTVTFDASAAITEHGLFSQAATGGGTLWDRSVFSAINVVSADSIQFTYDATFSAGG